MNQHQANKPYSASTKMQNTASTAQAGASGTAQAAVQGPARFNTFIGKLHAWEKLPIVHSRNVDTSGAVTTISVRTAQGALLLPTDIFVMAGSPFAGPVNRVLFSDPVTGESAEVDVVLYSACMACGNQGVSATLPRVHNRDISTTDARGAAFEPRNPSRTPATVHRGDNYQLYVYFTGGKRVLVEVDE
jgi:hypothetical protein